jgi:hypothetical protein
MQNKGFAVRLLPGGQNQGAGSLWRNFCMITELLPHMEPYLHCIGPPVPDYSISTTTIRTDYYGMTVTVWLARTYSITLKRFVLSYTNMPHIGNDWFGMTQNPGWPNQLVPYVEPGFALFSDDTYNLYHLGGPNSWDHADYSKEPGGVAIAGKIPPTKRSLDFIFPQKGIYAVDEGNSSRHATDQELADHFRMARCKTIGCKAEREAHSRSIEQIQSSLAMEGFFSDTTLQTVSSMSPDIITSSSANASQTVEAYQKLSPTTPLPANTGADSVTNTVKETEFPTRRRHGHQAIHPSHTEMPAYSKIAKYE